MSKNLHFSLLCSTFVLYGEETDFSGIRLFLEQNIDYPEWAKRQCKYMYNCGVIGFNNEALKNEYFET